MKGTSATAMDVTTAIVSWNTRELLDRCLQSVYETTAGVDFETIVVDNASSDGSAEMVRRGYPTAKLIQNAGNVGFARGNNQAYAAGAGRYFLLLNPDTICFPGALAGLVKLLDEHPRAGAVGPLVLNSDETLQYSWARFPTLWSEIRGKLDRRIEQPKACPLTADETRTLGPFRADWIGGCCLMVRRAAIEEIGPMDESLFMYCEETDWCMRLHSAGWEVWVNPDSRIVHLGGRSSAQSADAADHLRESKVAYFKKHHGLLSARILDAAFRAKQALKRAF